MTVLACLLGLPVWARAEWTPPVQLSGIGEGAALAEDGRGDSFAAWSECLSGCKERAVVADYLPAGAGSWQPPVQVSAGEQTYLSQLAADSLGDAIVLLSSPDGLESAVRRASLGAWQEPTPVGRGSREFGTDGLAVDAAGDAVVVWRNKDYAIEAAFRPAGSGEWEAPVAISIPGEHAEEPDIAIGEGGEVAAVWRAYEPETVPCPFPTPPSGGPCELIVKSKNSVKAAMRRAGGSWQGPITLASATNVGEPHVALDSAGNATALWRANSGGNRVIESSLRPAGSGWLAPVLVSSTPNPFLATERRLKLPDVSELDGSLQLVADSHGEVTAAWVHEYPTAGLRGGRVVETAMRRADGSWQAPLVISGPDRSVQILRLAENASGTAAAIWECYVPRQHPTSLRGAIRPTAGAGWQPGVEISGAEGGSPEVAVGPDGRAVLIWEQGGPFTKPAPAPGIYSSIYEVSLRGSGLAQSDMCAPPALSHLRMTRRRFRVDRAPTAINSKAASGTALLFNLSTVGDVSIALSRLTAGLKSGHLCLAPTRGLRHARAKRCQRAVAIATLTRRSEPRGEDRIPFTGRIGRRPLRPGNYAGRVAATNDAGSSTPARVRFEIVR